MMSAASSFEDHQMVAEACPVVLVRYRPGIVGETARTVHLVPLPSPGEQPEAATTLCDLRLRPDQIEIMNPGQGMPCVACDLSHAATSHAPLDRSAPTGPAPSPVPTVDEGRSTSWLAAVADYRLWGWPITLRRDQIRLRVGDDPLAVIMPEPLATQVSAILTARDCPAGMLAHPYAPDHRVLLATEPYGVVLPWPTAVRPITGTVLLPPSMTPRGPITWAHRPELDTVRSCREIDLFGALHTAQAVATQAAGNPEGTDSGGADR